jgi:uncharacterized protein YcfL
MAAGTANLTVEQGATYSATITVNNANGSPYDLTGCSVASQIRQTYSSEQVLVTPTVTIANAEAGQISFVLSASQTASLKVKPADGPEKRTTSYVYDILVTLADSTKLRLIEGLIEVSPGVTR